MKLTLSILFLLLISLGCRKQNINVPFEKIQGDYEWFYSDNGLAFDVSEDQFGIRITKKGRIKFFKNGEQLESDRIYSTIDLTSEVTLAYSGEEDDYIYYNIKSDTLWTWDYPHEEYRNYYLKTK